MMPLPEQLSVDWSDSLRRRLVRVLAVVATLLCLQAAAALAQDVLKLKNGTELRGTVLKEDDRQVVFEYRVGKASAQVTYQMAEVAEIRRNVEPEPAKTPPPQPKPPDDGPTKQPEPAKPPEKPEVPAKDHSDSPAAPPRPKGKRTIQLGTGKLELEDEFEWCSNPRPGQRVEPVHTEAVNNCKTSREMGAWAEATVRGSRIWQTLFEAPPGSKPLNLSVNLRITRTPWHLKGYLGIGSPVYNESNVQLIDSVKFPDPSSLLGYRYFYEGLDEHKPTDAQYRAVEERAVPQVMDLIGLRVLGSVRGGARPDKAYLETVYWVIGNHSNPKVRAFAIQCMPSDADEALLKRGAEVLLGALRDGDPMVRQAALHQITWRPWDKLCTSAALPRLLEMMRLDASVDVRLLALKTYEDYRRQELAKDKAPLILACTAGLADEAPAMREKCAWALANLGPDAASALDALVRLLDDKSPEVMKAAVGALGFMGDRAAAAIERLAAIAADPKARSYQGNDLRENALRALEKIPGGTERAVTMLIPLLGHAERDARRWAVQALIAVAAKGAPALPALKEAAADPKRGIESDAKEAIKAIEKALAKQNPGR